MTPAEWIDQVAQRATVEVVARAFGLQADRGRGLGPCPACGAARRGREDVRRPMGYSPRGWECYACGETGDALQLASWKVIGRRLKGATDQQRHQLRDACAAHGWCDPYQPTGSGTGFGYRRPAAPPPAPPPDPEPERGPPPEAEVLALWDACRPVTGDPAVAAWLTARLGPGGPVAVATYDCGRALPKDAPVPIWARYRGRAERSRPWTETTHRLICPVYDEAGRLRSVRARRLSPSDEGGGLPKSLPPTGYTSRGLVLACDRGRHLLRTGAAWDGWPAGRRLRVTISEGETDWLSWLMLRQGDGPRPAALFGVVNGSWSTALSARIPEDSVVTIWTDDDDGGQKIAGQIIDAFKDRRMVLLRGGADGCAQV